MPQTTCPETRQFHCASCRGEIQIPFDLPPTTGPCPHCGTSIDSPAPPVVFADREVRDQPVSSPLDPADPATPASSPEDRSEGLGSSAGLDPTPAVTGPVPDEEDSRPEEKRGLHPAILFLVAVVAIAGVLMALVILKRKDPAPGAPVVAVPEKMPALIGGEDHQQDREHFLEQGWKAEASKVLTRFLRARSAEEKARYVIGGDVLGREMAHFYRGASEIDESDTAIEGFSHQALDIADRRRGLFLMRFERPSQLKMSEFFRPVAPLEIQYGLKEPDLLLSSLAARDRFAMDPVRVMAFFKEANGTLLLDWHVYTQTKYRIFKHFITGPRPGVGGVFRVMVREALPASAAEKSANGARTFRLSDPAFGHDRITVSVPDDELSGQVLSELAWINMPGRSDQNRYATVRLSWTEGPESHIHLDEVICWEFLGLGGEIGNTDPIGGDTPGEDGSKEPVLPVLSEETTPVSVQEDVIPEATAEPDEGGSADDTTGQGEEEESATAPSLRE